MPAHFSYPYKKSAEQLFKEGFSIHEVANLAMLGDILGVFADPYDLDNPTVYNQVELYLRYHRYLYMTHRYDDDRGPYD